MLRVQLPREGHIAGPEERCPWFDLNVHLYEKISLLAEEKPLYQWLSGPRKRDLGPFKLPSGTWNP